MIAALIAVLIKLVIFGVIFGAAWWLLGKAGLQEPWNKAAQFILALLAFLVLLYLLLPMLGIKVL